MRNLKKALSMALALVMMLGMLTVASAKTAVADFIDLDKISADQKEAIMLLIDLGIVEGIKNADGKYEVSPEAKIDRNSYAKIVFMALQATSDASPYMGGSTLKGVAGTWAEGYVNFLASLKCVAGDLEGNFNGSDNLTVAQACKIMLTAMGYDAIHRGYEQDANWSINIMRDAQRFGLMEGVGQAATAEITRENAFRVIYNALFATSVTPIKNRDMGEWIVTGYENDNTLGLKAYNLVKVTANLGGVGAISNFTIAAPAQIKDGTAAKFSHSALKSAAEKAYPVGPSDVGGRFTFYAKVSSYANNNVAGATFTLYSAKATTDTGNVLSTTYGNRTIKQLMNTKGNSDGNGKHSAYVAEPASAVNVYLNGVASGTITTDANGATGLDNGLALGSSAGRGIIVDLIGDSDGKVSVIRITQKTAHALTANAESNSSNQVRVPGVSNLASYSSSNTTSNVFGWEGLKKGDVVLVANIDGNYYLEKATRVEDELSTRNSDGTVTMKSGTVYYKSNLTKSISGDAKAYTAISDLAFTTQYALYLDNGKNLVAFEALSEDVSNNIAFVLETSWVGGTGDMTSSSYAQAKLLYTDGTVEVVRVKAALGDTSLNDTDWNACKNSGASTSGLGTLSKQVFGKFVNFKKDSDNRATLTALASSLGQRNGDLSSYTYTKGKNVVAGSGTSISVNANTVFILALKDGSDTVYRTYTGTASTPSFKITGTVDQAGAVTKSGFATFVYAQAELTGTTGQLLFIETLDYYENADGDFVYTGIYVNGVLPDDGVIFTKELVEADTAHTANPTGQIAVMVGGLYKVSSRDGDAIDTLSRDGTSGNAAGNGQTPYNFFKAGNGINTITASSGGVITVDGKNYDFDGDTKVYIANYDGELVVGSIGDIAVTPSSPTKEDFKAYVIDDDGYATTIYLIYATYVETAP